MLSILLLVILIVEIVLLVFSIKKKDKKYWIGLFCLEVISLVMPFIMSYYFHQHHGTGKFAGLEDMGNAIMVMFTLYTYFTMFCASIISCIIVYEKKSKHNPLFLIIAFVLLLYGANYLYIDIKDNYGKYKTIGTIIEYDSTHKNNEWAVIKFNADGEDRYDSYPIINEKIGDNKEYYYYIKDGKYELTSYVENNKDKWIPSLSISLILIIIRLTSKPNKNKKRK